MGPSTWLAGIDHANICPKGQLSSILVAPIPHHVCISVQAIFCLPSWQLSHRHSSGKQVGWVCPFLVPKKWAREPFSLAACSFLVFLSFWGGGWSIHPFRAPVMLETAWGLGRTCRGQSNGHLTWLLWTQTSWWFDDEGLSPST